MSENESDSNDTFIIKNSILFKKYKLIKKLCSGAFGNIYLGYFLHHNSYVAIKTEPRKIPSQHLETEAYFLYTLKGIGIPEVLSYGRTKYYNILVEPLLGKSLYHLYLDNNRHFKIKDICLIGIQILDRLEWIHSKNVIHRDIKPDNFLIGENDPNVLYLIDFGLSSKYRSSSTGKHVKFGFTGKLTGTTKYSSANSIRGGEQSRKDDLESVAYMIIFFMKGDLPWENIKSYDENDKYYKIYMMKKYLTAQQLCEGLPIQIYKFLKYVKELQFEEQPDYNYLRSLFKDLLYKYKYIYNNKISFSWVDKNIVIRNNASFNIFKRKSNFHSRLFKYIQKQLEIKENNIYSNPKTINQEPVRNKYIINNISKKKTINNTINGNINVASKNRVNNLIYKRRYTPINSDTNSMKNDDIKTTLKRPIQNFGNFSELNYVINDIDENYINYINLRQREIKKFNNNKKNNINNNNQIINFKRNMSNSPKKKTILFKIKENNEKKRNITNNINNRYNKIIKNNNLNFKNNNYNSFNNNKSYNFNKSNNINNINNKILKVNEDKIIKNKNLKKSKEYKVYKSVNNETNNKNKKYLLNNPLLKTTEFNNNNNIKNNININQSNNENYITKIINNNYNYYSIFPTKKFKTNNNTNNTNNNNVKGTNNKNEIHFNNLFYVNTMNNFNV